MRICVFSIVNYWHGVRGGMEIHGKLLSEGMVNRGHDVTIITTRHPDGLDYEAVNGVKIYYLIDTVFGSRRKNWSTASVTKFIQLHKEKPFDIIWSQSFAAYGLTALKRNPVPIPVVAILQGGIEIELNLLRYNLKRILKSPPTLLKSILSILFSYFRVQRPLLNISKRIVAASFEMIEDLRRFYGERIAIKATPIFNGIDAAHFSTNKKYRDIIRRKYGIEDQHILLMTLGTLNKEKGHYLAIEALSKIRRRNKNIKLMIVGIGEDKNNLENKIRELGLKHDVVFTGFVENEQTVMYYNCADIFLLPTLRIEGLPFVLLEAMSCGKPVIASRTGGNTSVIKDGVNGLLIKPGSVEDLIAKIQMITNNKNLAERLSLTARNTILDQFTIDQMINKNLELLVDIAE